MTPVKRSITIVFLSQQFSKQSSVKLCANKLFSGEKDTYASVYIHDRESCDMKRTVASNMFLPFFPSSSSP